MRNNPISRIVHNLFHRHVFAEKPGMGTFQFCVSRFGSHGTVTYQPDPDVDIWHKVPYRPFPDGTTLASRMTAADNAADAMAMLHDAQQEQP